MGAPGVKELYREWYWPDDDDLKVFVTEGRIVLDANVLLDLYRHSATNRERLLDALNQESVRPRLFLPYQAGLEYHRRRLTVASDHENHYNAVLEAVSNLDDGVSKAMAALRDKQVRATLAKRVDKALRKAKRSIREAIKAEQEANVIPATNLRVDDPIRDRIEKLLTDEGQIGHPPSDELAAAWMEQWKASEALPDEEKPPGFKDGKKKDGGYGDYFIWQEMLEVARESDTPVLFISGDDKSDWMDRPGGRTLGVRTHLRREFYRETSQPFHKIDWAGFLELLNKHMGSRIEQEVIDATKSRRQATLQRPPADATIEDLIKSGYISERRKQLAEFLSDRKNDPSEVEITVARHLLSTPASDRTVSALADLLAATGPHETSSAFAHLMETRPDLFGGTADDAIRRLKEARGGLDRLPLDLPSGQDNPDLFDE